MLFFACLGCSAQTISLEGIGISIRQVGQIYRFKGDHIDTASWDEGVIFPMADVPARVKGMEYAYHDWRPASDDSRTNDTISRIKSDEAGDLLIAMPSEAASGDGWKRVTSGSAPDFHLESAGRNKPRKPDPASPYWFYQFHYTSPGEWVSLPKNSVTTDHSPFVFARPEELRWENPPPLMGHAVTITQKNKNPVASTLANPNLMIMPNGDCLAMISNSVDGTALYRSVDKGLTWKLVHNQFAVNVYSLFEHKGSIYVIGANTDGPGNTRIYKSGDNGRTWVNKVFKGNGGGDAPSHVDIANGRIWKAGYAGTGPGFYSAPVDADLMKESNWTLTVGTYNKIRLKDGTEFQNGNEASLVKAKDGTLFSLGKSSVYRPELGWRGGITTQQPDPADLTKTTWDPDCAGAMIPQQSGKFTMRYDAKSGRYWTLCGGENRGQINVFSAPGEGSRIGDFVFRGTFLDSESNGFQGFNYPFMQIDGDDLIFVLRTAWDTERGRSTRWHDGNLFTFHRIKDFRRLTGPGNYLSNPGFEEGMAGWYTTPLRSGNAAISETKPHAGAKNLTHRSDALPYKVLTYKTVLSLVPGSYTLRAWVRSSGGQNECKLGVSDYGGPPLSRPISKSSDYTQIEIPHINVTGWMCRIGLWSDAKAGNWVEIDDIEFTRDEVSLESGKSYQIIVKHSQKCLTVDAGSKPDGADVVQSGSKGANSLWQIVDAGGGYFRISSTNGGKDLSVAKGSAEEGANIVQSASSASGEEGRWKLVPAGDGYYQIVSKRSGTALNVEKESKEDGAHVVPYRFGYQDNQAWRFFPVD